MSASGCFFSSRRSWRRGYRPAAHRASIQSSCCEENDMNDLKFAVRQLRKSPGFTFVVIVTLALGIGANAAIFTLVRGVLIKPLVNREEDRLIYIRQSAPGARIENSTWSIPEIQDLKAGIKTLSEFGDFSAIAFTIIGLGEPREVNGGVVNGSFFEVMGLRPV